MTILNFKGKNAPKAKRSAMETLIFTQEEINQWQLPRFQRPLHVNEKVRTMSEEMKSDGGIIPGILTLGHLDNDKTTYLVDGQHRVEGFKLSELPECIADVRIVSFQNVAQMAEEFTRLNSRLVNMRPDDLLRAMAESLPLLNKITDNCSFVGYGQVRRNTNSPLISMSALLRSWHASNGETPAMAGVSAAALADDLTEIECNRLIEFMQVARDAWGYDPENYRLWSAINLILVMWLWRKLVLEKQRGVKRYSILGADDFKRCLMSVAADKGYSDWLVGRKMGERDRSPCYVRLRSIFLKRLHDDGGSKKYSLPAPNWASVGGNK